MQCSISLKILLSLKIIQIYTAKYGGVLCKYGANSNYYIIVTNVSHLI